MDKKKLSLIVTSVAALAIIVGAIISYTKQDPRLLKLAKTKPELARQLIKLDDSTKKINTNYKKQLEKAEKDSDANRSYAKLSKIAGTDVEQLSNAMESVFGAIESRAMTIEDSEEREFILTMTERYKELLNGELMSNLMEKEVLDNMSVAELKSLEQTLTDKDVSMAMEKQNELATDIKQFEIEMKEVSRYKDSERIKLLEKEISPKLIELLTEMQIESLKFSTSTVGQMFDPSANSEESKKVFNERYASDKVKAHMQKASTNAILAASNYATKDLSKEELTELLAKANTDEKRKFDYLQMQALVKHFRALNH